MSNTHVWTGLALAAALACGTAAAAETRADCHAASVGETPLRPLTQARLTALIGYNQKNGKAVWIKSDVAGLILPEDQFESGPGQAVTLKTDKGDYILFEQATDAIGALFFAHRTWWGDVYVFRLDHDMNLKIALVKSSRGRSMRRLDNCQAQRHLDIVLDEWAQVMDLERGARS
jgi:hypothetical protein